MQKLYFCNFDFLFATDDLLGNIVWVVVVAANSPDQVLAFDRYQNQQIHALSSEQKTFQTVDGRQIALRALRSGLAVPRITICPSVILMDGHPA